MRRIRFWAFGSLAIAATAAAVGQETSTLETGPDGATYRVTRRVTHRAVPHIEMQTREQKFFRPQVRTEYKTIQQTYVTPVTQYQWVARKRGWWNPFGQPYWSHELVPITRWETRSATVQLPVSRTDWVEETRTTQVPVTTYRTVQDESISRVFVSAPPTGAATENTAVASRLNPASSRPAQGGNVPKDPSPWSAAPAPSSYRR